jgi:hypothetical protein
VVLLAMIALPSPASIPSDVSNPAAALAWLATWDDASVMRSELTSALRQPLTLKYNVSHSTNGSRRVDLWMLYESTPQAHAVKGLIDSLSGGQRRATNMAMFNADLGITNMGADAEVSVEHLDAPSPPPPSSPPMPPHAPGGSLSNKVTVGLSLATTMESFGAAQRVALQRELLARYSAAEHVTLAVSSGSIVVTAQLYFGSSATSRAAAEHAASDLSSTPPADLAIAFNVPLIALAAPPTVALELVAAPSPPPPSPPLPSNPPPSPPLPTAPPPPWFGHACAAGYEHRAAPRGHCEACVPGAFGG